MSFAVIIPVRDRAGLLQQCLEAVQAAAHGVQAAIDVIVVDNGSRDDSIAVAERFAPWVTVISSDAATAAGVRNAGAQLAGAAAYLAFIDSDCLVPVDFFSTVERLFTETGASACGGDMRSPVPWHWTGPAWDRLHLAFRDGPRPFINSACFVIRREWFERIGGFDAGKESSEDVDICARLRRAGGTLYQSTRLEVLHLGTPKSIGGVYRRIRWHNEGVIEPGRPIQWSPMTVATIAHTAMALTGTIASIALSVHAPGRAVLLLLVAWLVVPVLFVVARMVQHRRWIPLGSSVALMSITFPARVHGMLIGVGRKLRRFGASVPTS